MTLLPSAGILAPMPDSALRQHPHEVARDTFVIRAVMPSVAGTFTNQNSMLIRAAQPVVVDTGMVTNRELWFEDVFSLVAPEELRWIFVTHIDTDHAGNLVEALALCPNAMMVTSRGESYRASASLGIPIERMRMVGGGKRSTSVTGCCAPIARLSMTAPTPAPCTIHRPGSIMPPMPSVRRCPRAWWIGRTQSIRRCGPRAWRAFTTTR